VTNPEWTRDFNDEFNEVLERQLREGNWTEPPDDRESEEDFTARVDAMNEEYPL
jgi:hypothetical protein